MTSKNADSQPHKILVVDDLEITRMATALTLEFMGYAPEQANNAMQALELFESNQYAAIIMDHDMPKMTGPECAIKIRHMEKGRTRKTPIICLTANRTERVEVDCLNAGMECCLDKGCAVEVLRDVLRKFINN